MTRICTQALPLFSSVELLEICGCEDGYSQKHVENTRWIAFFQPFTAVERLHITEHLGPLTLSALRMVIGRRATEVLPALRSLFLEAVDQPDSLQDDTRRSVTVRRDSGHPVAVCRQKSEWERDLGWERYLEVDD